MCTSELYGDIELRSACLNVRNIALLYDNEVEYVAYTIEILYNNKNGVVKEGSTKNDYTKNMKQCNT